MSYVTKRGQEAIESATEEQIDYSKILKPFTSGKSYNVRVPAEGAFVEYFAHSVYKVFFTTPCTKVSGTPDLYDKAVDLLYADAKKADEAGNEERAEELREEAYQLKAKKRYLAGFFDLSTGEPIVLDMTKNQAEGVIEQFKKRKGKAATFAFTISKTGTGKNTKTSLDIVIDAEEELSQPEQDMFAKTEGKEFDYELFDKVLSVAGEDQQIEDLEKFGFDVSRLGVEGSTSGESEGNEGQSEGESEGEGENLGF